MDKTIVVMAAGLGSRYGGVKQIERLGPDGEILMEYAIYDAIRAGFNRIVLIIKPEIYNDVRELFGNRIEESTGIKIDYAFQTLDRFTESRPEFKARTKPFGTVHALLCAESAVDGPFCVINADDYYGVDAYRTIYEELVKLPAESKGTMVGYLLKNTASLHGTVSRGVCKVKDGKLDTIQEALKVQLYPDGHLTDLDTDTDLAPDTVVSMNFWGFMPSIFPALRTYFENFLRGLPDDAVKAECLLPLMVGEEVKAGRMTVSVLHSKDRWFGMTYREDRAVVAEDLRRLHESGVYPPSLRD